MNKLHFYNRKEAIARMNRFGARGTAFFFLINFDETECLVSELKDISPDRLAFIFPEVSNVSLSSAPKPEAIYWKSAPQSYEDYVGSFDIVYRNLYAGNSFLTNLTCATPVSLAFLCGRYSNTLQLATSCGTTIVLWCSLPKPLCV